MRLLLARLVPPRPCPGCPARVGRVRPCCEGCWRRLPAHYQRRWRTASVHRHANRRLVAEARAAIRGHFTNARQEAAIQPICKEA